MHSRAHLITKETYPKYAKLIKEGKARRARERTMLLELVEKLQKASPAQWLDKLEQQSTLLHDTILRTMQTCTAANPGPACDRLNSLLKAQGLLISQRRSLIGDKEPVPVHEEVEPVSMPAQETEPVSPQEQPGSSPDTNAEPIESGQEQGQDASQDVSPGNGNGPGLADEEQDPPLDI